MDFRFTKPTHVFVLLGLLCSLLLFIGYPLFSLLSPPQIPSIYTPLMTPIQKLTMEMTLLFIQFLFVFVSLILVPVLWYILVNKLSFREMFFRLQLHRKRLDQAIFWGFITVVIAFTCTIAIGLVYLYLTKMNPSSVSNIPDLQKFFSIPSLYLLVTIQPFCEEFFFRGFLFEKLTKIGGVTSAVIITAVLFGISHLTYTYAYTALIAVLLGVLFAWVVVKTKNLFSAIFAHTVINITSLTLFFLGKSIGL